MSEAYPLDLVVLLPGNDERETFDALLSKRSYSLAVRPIVYRLVVHPRRDPGCYHEAPEVLQIYQKQAEYALVCFDFEGSGQEAHEPAEVENALRERMNRSGWGDRAEVIVLNPELENWVWSMSPEVDNALGWRGRNPKLRQWLVQENLWPPDRLKPPRPKEAMEKSLRMVQERRSSSIYREIAQKVGLASCQDPAFNRFKDVMRRWFGTENGPEESTS